MVKCPNCGSQNMTGAQFCGDCGSNIAQQQEPAQHSPKPKKSPVLAIVIVVLVSVIIVIAGFYVWVAGSSSNDPFEGYTVDIDGYFNGASGINTKGPVTNRIGYRLKPLGVMAYGDRLYVGGGDGSPISPYGVYAYDSEDGSREWSAQAFSTLSPVTTNIVVENYGSQYDSNHADVRIFFGCENGYIYVLQDEFDSILSGYPPDGVPYVWKYELDGAVSERIVFYKNDTWTGTVSYEFDENDLFFASTDEGILYGFRGPGLISGGGAPPMETPVLMWENQLSTQELTSPTVSEDGKYVYVGTRDGKLHGLDTATGMPIPGWGGATYSVSNDVWSTNPVCVGNPPFVYATNNNGYIHAIDGLTGTAKSGWEGGVRVVNINDDIDGGELTEPVVTQDGSSIFFGSSTGFVYSYGSDGILNKDFDTTVGNADTDCIVAPYFDSMYSRQFFVAVNCHNDTPDPSDDYSFFYCLDAAFNVSWRMQFEGMILAPPICYNPAGLLDHLYNADVVFATVNVEPDGTYSEGRLYSFGSVGIMVPV